MAISVGNYIKDRLWWAPLINSFLANKVKDCLEEFQPYVMKPSPQSEDNNIPNDSYGLSVENSENLEEKIDQVSTRLSSLEVTGAELCWIQEGLFDIFYVAHPSSPQQM